jgi:hypothetical protein
LKEKQSLEIFARKVCTKENRIPGLAAIVSRRGKSSAITNVNNDE